MRENAISHIGQYAIMLMITSSVYNRRQIFCPRGLVLCNPFVSVVADKIPYFRWIISTITFINMNTSFPWSPPCQQMDNGVQPWVGDVITTKLRMISPYFTTIQWFVYVFVDSMTSIDIRTDQRFAPSEWETVLLCNDVSHWLGARLESTLNMANEILWNRDAFKMWKKRLGRVEFGA